jgi:hypothetical protein
MDSHYVILTDIDNEPRISLAPTREDAAAFWSELSPSPTNAGWLAEMRAMDHDNGNHHELEVPGEHLMLWGKHAETAFKLAEKLCPERAMDFKAHRELHHQMSTEAQPA